MDFHTSNVRSYCGRSSQKQGDSDGLFFISICIALGGVRASFMGTIREHRIMRNVRE
jgi:hypothetical protein